MIRVVLDANQFVSALLKPHSNSGQILSLISEDKIALLASDEIITEITDVLLYPRIMKRIAQSPGYLKTFMERIWSVAIITEGKIQVAIIDDDPSDNKYLSCALEGKADFIISGDRHLKDFKSYKNIAIVDPGTFLAIIKQKGEEDRALRGR